LRQSLFSGYDSYVRPVKDQNTPTNVTLDLSLMQVISMVIRDRKSLNYLKKNSAMKFNQE